MRIKRLTKVSALFVLPILLYAVIAEQASWRPTIRKAHQGRVKQIAFSREGKLLVSASEDSKRHSQFVLSNSHSLEPVRDLPTPKSCEVIAFAPDLKIIAYSEAYVHHYKEYNVDEEYRRIVLCEATTGKRLSARGQYYSVDTFAFSPRGDLLASGAISTGMTFAGQYGWWNLWRVQGRTLQGPLFTKNTDRVCCLCFSHTGQTIATGLLDGSIKLWNTRSYKLLRMLDGQKKDGEDDSTMVTDIAFSPNGDLIASGHADNTIWLWNPQTGKPLHIFKGHSQPVTQMEFSPDGGILASGSTDGRVKLWDVQAGKESRTLEAPHGGVYSLAISPDGTALANGYKDGSIALWRIK